MAKWRSGFLRGGILLLLGAGLWALGVGTPGLPDVTDLGTLGGDGSGACAINNRGDIIGTGDRKGNGRAFLLQGMPAP